MYMMYIFTPEITPSWLFPIAYSLLDYFTPCPKPRALR